MSTTRHIAVQGDTLSQLASAHGLATWRTIYDHPDNADLRRRRPNPDMLLPGDPVCIPNREERHHRGATETRHKLKVSRAPMRIRIKLVGEEDNEVLGFVDYRLTLGGADHPVRTTKRDGMVEFVVPGGVVDGRLTLTASGDSWKLIFGYLDPLRDTASGAAFISGVQARLNNLDYDAGPVDGVVGPKTTHALRRFQQHAMPGRPATERDTLQALEQAHGC